MSKQIVILGAGYAGLFAAIRLARKTRNTGTRVILINKREEFVERIRLHEQAVRPARPARRLADFFKGTGAEVVIGNVSTLDLQGRQVSVQTANGSRDIGYDKLVYALGSTVHMDALPGAREHAFTFTAQSVLALREQLHSSRQQRQRPVLIVGGGLTGVEAAAEFAEAFLGTPVILATRDEVAPSLSTKARDYIRRTMARLGVDLREHLAVTQLQDHVAQTSAGPLPFEVCLWAGPFVAPPLASAAGLAVNVRGQILVDQYLRAVSHPDVYAIGDAAWLSENPTPVRMACASATPMGLHATYNILAELQAQPIKPFEMAFNAKCVSLGRHDAVLDWANADDSPQNKIWTGPRATLMKELICRSVPFMIRNERYWTGSYEAQQKRKPDAVPANPSTGKPVHNASSYARNARGV